MIAKSVQHTTYLTTGDLIISVSHLQTELMFTGVSL